MAKKKLNKEQILEISKEIAITKTDGLASMREIANKLNVSVGTIYNYYNNQESLWCDVFNEMWESTETSINDILIKDINNVEKIRRMIIVISRDIRKRNGFGFRLFDQLGSNKQFNEIYLFDVNDFLINSLNPYKL